MTTENTTNYVSDLHDEEDTNITESMTREQFESFFRENREIKYKNLTIGVMEWGDGRFDVLTPADNEDGYSTLNPNAFTNACDAIDFAIDHLVEYDKDRNPDGTKIEPKKTSKKKSSKPKEPKYDGPRIIKVFGREIYIEEDTNAKFEDIRVKLVTEYNFPNFKKDKVFYDFDESTGTLEVLLKFQTKG
jgi:hypothetical protein|nr:MAG TPA: hypothetical protein [Caudoviricetes sp.]